MRSGLLAALAGLVLSACAPGVAPTATVRPVSSQPPTNAIAMAGSTAALQPPTSTPARAIATVAGQPTAVRNTCRTPVSATIAQTEGPYFKAGTPQRTSLLEPGVEGTSLVIGGHVLTADCAPVAGVVLEFWQADANGTYDNGGYRLRGHLSTDAQGRYVVTTIVPGLYPGRTRHIHVKPLSPSGASLTTQLYSSNEPQNARDGIFELRLVMAVVTATDGAQMAIFDFVLVG